MIRHLLVAATLLLSSPGLSAQAQIRIVGEVVAGGGDFALRVADVELQSSTINLSTWNGRQVDLRGQFVSGYGTPRLEVQTIARADSWFSIGSESRIGRSMTVRISTPPSQYFYYAYYFLSLDLGFTPLDNYPPVSGTWLLDPAATVTMGSGLMADQDWAQPLAIPDDPALVGLHLFFQGAVLSGIEALYLNVEEVTLR